jgi:hypothetical protein
MIQLNIKPEDKQIDALLLDTMFWGAIYAIQKIVYRVLIHCHVKQQKKLAHDASLILKLQQYFFYALPEFDEFTVNNVIIQTDSEYITAIGQ